MVRHLPHPEGPPIEAVTSVKVQPHCRHPVGLAENKELAARDGVSVNQFIASAAAEKMASVMTLDYLRAEAALGRRSDFLSALDSAPDVAPPRGDQMGE